MKLNTGEKIQLTITLNEWESRLLRAATKIACPQGYCEGERSDFRRMLHLALWAFLRAVIIENRKIGMPVMAELRAETENEQRTRIADEIPMPESSRWQVRFSDFGQN